MNSTSFQNSAPDGGVPGVLAGASTLAQASDKELVARALLYEDGWTALVECYSRLVYKIALTSGLEANAAEQVYRNVFARAVEQLDSLPGHASLSDWFVQTTTQEVATVKDHLPVKEARQELPSDKLNRVIKAELVRVAVNRLPETERTVLTQALESAPAEFVGTVSPTGDQTLSSKTLGDALNRLRRLLAEMNIPSRFNI